MRKTLLGLAATAALACTPAFASIDSYTAFLVGSNETGGGDTDGFGAASVLIDNVARTASWAIMVQNIQFPLTGAHIHSGAFGVAGPIIVDFSGNLSGSNLFDNDLGSINPTNASAFYVNVHNAVFPGGAIRGQLQYVGTVTAPIPEPASYALFAGGLAAIGLFARRRRPG